MLEDFKVNDSAITINLSAARDIPLCKSPRDFDKWVRLLTEVKAGSRKIEVFSNTGDACVFDISATPSDSERVLLVEKALKTLLPQSNIRLSDFDRINVAKDGYSESSADIEYLYVPYNTIGLREIGVPWNKKNPGDELYYYVSQINAIRNTPDQSGHEEITQGEPDFENFPYTSNRLDPSLLDLIRTLDKKHAAGIFRKARGHRTDLVVLDKPGTWVVKRIVHGLCSQDRTITVLKIDKATRKALLPITTTKIDGGECPD